MADLICHCIFQDLEGEWQISLVVDFSFSWSYLLFHSCWFATGPKSALSACDWGNE